ncbi:MAG: DUF309 domain-containing protein [Gemmatimonadota bacterium]
MKEHGPASPDAFSPELARFLDLFREGRYWASHEALEGAWRENRSRFYKGLILYASAFVHAGRGNTHGLRAQLRKATQHLQPYRPAYLGFDVTAILKHARQCLDGAEDEEDVTRLPPPALDWDPRRVRGDEQELAPPQEP